MALFPSGESNLRGLGPGEETSSGGRGEIFYEFAANDASVVERQSLCLVRLWFVSYLRGLSDKNQSKLLAASPNEA